MDVTAIFKALISFIEELEKSIKNGHTNKSNSPKH